MNDKLQFHILRHWKRIMLKCRIHYKNMYPLGKIEGCFQSRYESRLRTNVYFRVYVMESTLRNSRVATKIT